MLDCYEPLTAPEVPCKDCGAPTTRIILAKSSNVLQDSIEGGVWIRHGLVDESGNPQKFYSHSEIAREAKRRGLVQWVEHAPDPTSGSDKSKHTVKWV